MKRTHLLPTLRSPISLLVNLCSLFFSFLPRKSFGVENPYFRACGVHSTCGDGQNISFPFYIQDKPKFLCGYPGFQLSCNNNGQPTINISNSNHTIHNISYESHILRVSNAAFSNSTNDCIPLAENISLHGIRFELAPYQSLVHLLYGCNSSLQLRRSALDFYPGCDGGNKNVPVLALHERDPKLRYVSDECTTRVVAPVEAHGGDIRESLRSGFLVTWKASDRSICKESGGRCGFDRMTYLFKCFCPDRPHASHCRPAVPEKTRRGEAERVDFGSWRGAQKMRLKSECSFQIDGINGNHQGMSTIVRNHAGLSWVMIRELFEDDVFLRKEFNRNGSQLSKSTPRWERGQERNTRISSKIVDEVGLCRNEYKKQ